MPYFSGINFVLWGLITWSLHPQPIIKIPTNLIATNIEIEKILWLCENNKVQYLHSWFKILGKNMYTWVSVSASIVTNKVIAS